MIRHAGEVLAVALTCNRMTYGELHYPAKTSIKLYAGLASGMFIGVPVGNGDPPDGSRSQQICRVLFFVFVSRINPC